ncbi:ABC transporter permease [Streptomyces sp. 4N509B]|uniref:ABC transporter permease n=1 Tax=Streptomyces sp. 4N509B TaxID=3457413 RepID=UPI003FD2ACD9
MSSPSTHSPSTVDHGAASKAAARPANTTPRRPTTPRGAARGTWWIRPNLAAALVSLLVVGTAWELIGRQMNPIYTSYPSAIAEAFGEMVSDGTLVEAIGDSMRPMLTGFLLAAAVGIPLGLLIGRYRWVEATIGFYVTAGYATPLVALIPLFLVWFGLGFSIKVAIVVLMTVFPIVISTWSGVRAVPRPMIEVGRSFVASEWAIMRKIIVPSTLPHIMTGLRLGIGRAVIGIVIAEFFTAIGGLGGIILTSGQRFDTASMFVPVIVLMVLGVGLTNLVGFLESKIAPWQRQTSGARDDG